jgi:hypothetical protein
MALVAADKNLVVSHWAQEAFVKPNALANFSTADILAAATAIDNAFDTTLTVALAAVGGGTTVINALAASIPAPFSGATVQQKTLLAVHVLMKRAGLSF